MRLTRTRMDAVRHKQRNISLAYLCVYLIALVALGIGQLRIGKLLFGGHSSKALHSVPYAQIPNAQLPKQPLMN